MAGACNLVGNFQTPPELGCLISVSISSSTEAQKIDDCLIKGPTIGSISLSGYATDRIHTGDPGRASVSISWIRKFDCDNNQTYFIFSGEGRSSVAGDIGGLASINDIIASHRMINASAASGPAAIYTDETQTDGYGLRYTGNPIAFDTKTSGSQLSFTDWFNVGADYYLQSFNLQCTPGSIPVATYSFVFAIPTV